VSHYDEPDAQLLIAEVQAEYVRIYGGEDETPVDPGEFAEPHGRFVVGYLNQTPVAMGGWRKHGSEHPETRWATSAAEIKRMYVSPSARGRGFARLLLANLEETSRTAGVDWLLLETGLMQPEAIALYRSSGYHEVPPFGHYATARSAVHLGKRLNDRLVTDQPAGGSFSSSR
jgi:GNAT superfamily N-acetyltransferase